MPLERVLGLEKKVDEEEEERERRKTFRAGAKGVGEGGRKLAGAGGEKVESWTTGEVMEGWADERGFGTFTSRPGSLSLGFVRALSRLIADFASRYAMCMPQ